MFLENDIQIIRLVTCNYLLYYSKKTHDRILPWAKLGDVFKVKNNDFIHRRCLPSHESYTPDNRYILFHRQYNTNPF